MDEDRGTPAPIRVLVADDAESLRTLVRITLTSQGWRVSEAATAEAALASARADPPDLAILDITFGDTGPDGLAVCAELKGDPKTSRIPILVLTAHDDPAERRRAVAAGADAFVAKPFGPLELMDELRRLLPAAQTAPALGVLLLDAGAVEPSVLERALAEQRELSARGTPKRLGDVLLSRGHVSSGALDRALLEQMHARSAHEGGARGRVLIVDDHAAVREGLKSLLREDDTVEVVGEAASAAEGMRLARRHRPDVVVIDNEMPGTSGLEVLRPLRAEVPEAKIVMFSLDDTVRERALAEGADVFVTKDASMDDILDAVHPARPVSAPAPLQFTMPRRDPAYAVRRAALVVTLALAAYALVFVVVEAWSGAGAAAFSVMPVVIIGALLGPEAGLIGAVLTIILTAGLWTATGHGLGEPILEIGVPGVGMIVLLLLGYAAGAMRILGPRFDARRRRIAAIEEAARALSGLERGEFIDSFLAATVHLVSGELALLFSNAAGDAHFVEASGKVAPELAERLGSVVAEAMRSANPRTIDALALEQRPAPELGAAAVVPISVAGQEVRGAIVVLRRAPSFSVDDVALIRPFAQYLWVVLRAGAPSAAAATAGRVRERPS